MTGQFALSDKIVDWIAAAGGGEVRRVERAVARREAWLVDVDRPDGSTLEGFLRLALPDDPANSSAALDKETRVVQALAGTRIPVPRIHGVCEDPHLVLFERVPGRSDLHHTEPAQQDAVYRHYLEILGELHQLDADALDLPPMHRPETAYDVAMSEVEQLSRGADVLGPQPLAKFGAEWLRRNAPEHVARIALLHGDSGIANFMFVDDRITAAIDWEWAHFGDPMEDLGSAMIHASYSTSGEWPDLLRHYEKSSGIPVELDKIYYYRAHLMVRSVIALNYIRNRLNSRDPVAFNQCVSIIGDRLLCDAIAEAIGIEPERPDVPEVSTDPTWYDIVVENLRNDIAPNVTGDYPSDLVQTSALMVETLKRQHELGAWLESTELDELAGLLGSRPSDLASGRAALQELVLADDGSRDEDLVRALGRIAWRAEVVAAPVVSLFPNVNLRPVT
jgi:aminoglycoside phosphotransferase (APT) family kinase protein